MAVGVGPELPVGTIIYSILSAAAMLSEHGNMWVLADGQSVAGSRYAQVVGSNVPDLRGAFLRGKGATYNPDGDLPVGTYTASRLGSHNHQMVAAVGNRVPTGATYSPSANPGGVETTVTGTAITNLGGTSPLMSGATGSSETASMSITMYIYIKVN